MASIVRLFTISVISLSSSYGQFQIPSAHHSQFPRQPNAPVRLGPGSFPAGRNTYPSPWLQQPPGQEAPEDLRHSLSPGESLELTVDAIDRASLDISLLPCHGLLAWNITNPYGRLVHRFRTSSLLYDKARERLGAKPRFIPRSSGILTTAVEKIRPARRPFAQLTRCQHSWTRTQRGQYC